MKYPHTYVHRCNTLLWSLGRHEVLKVAPTPVCCPKMSDTTGSPATLIESKSPQRFERSTQTTTQHTRLTTEITRSPRTRTPHARTARTRAHTAYRSHAPHTARTHCTPHACTAHRKHTPHTPKEHTDQTPHARTAHRKHATHTTRTHRTSRRNGKRTWPDKSVVQFTARTHRTQLDGAVALARRTRDPPYSHSLSRCSCTVHAHRLAHSQHAHRLMEWQSERTARAGRTNPRPLININRSHCLMLSQFHD